MKMSRTEYTRRWRLANPEKLAELRKKEALREKTLEVRTRRNAYRREHLKNPEAKAKMLARRARWFSKPGIKEYYRQYYREKNAALPWYMPIVKAKNRCKATGMEYSLSQEWAISTWTGRCALSGLPLLTGTGRQEILSPSLDRIDSSKGYTPENCRFICWGINRFKGDDTDSDIMMVARAMLGL